MRLKTVLAAFLILIAQFAFSKTQLSIQTKSFEVSPGGMLDVSISGGDILLGTWEKNEVYVKAEGIDPDELERLIMTQSGNRVRVQYEPEWGESMRVRFTINVPSQFNSDLHTSGGDIRLQGLFQGKLDGSTSGGDITIADIDGTVDMNTSGGDITAGKIKGTCSLSTSGGDIQVELSTGEVQLSTSGGDITIGNVGKSLVAKTSGGDIHIGDVGGEATAITAGGDIIIGRVSGNATLKTAGGDVQLRGASGIVKAKTAGGDMSLVNISGSIDASTAGGDVEAELRPSGSGRSRLTSSGGDIILSIPENAKASIEAVISVRGRWRENSEDYSIESDFKSKTYEKDPDTKEIRATFLLNGGGEEIILETVNGNIMIRKLLK